MKVWKKRRKKHNYIFNFKKQEIKERKIKTKWKKQTFFLQYQIIIFCYSVGIQFLPWCVRQNWLYCKMLFTPDKSYSFALFPENPKSLPINISFSYLKVLFYFGTQIYLKKQCSRRNPDVTRKDTWLRDTITVCLHVLIVKEEANGFLLYSIVLLIST